MKCKIYFHLKTPSWTTEQQSSSFLLRPVFSYECYSAFYHNSTTYNEHVTECLGDRCMTASQHTYVNGTIFKSIMKGCANETVCGADGLAKVSEKFNFIFHVNCCSGNLCNTDGYYLPPEDPTPNGVKCPSAFCTGSLEECESDEEMECTGSMDRCFEYRQRIINEGGEDQKYSMKGCANYDACSLNFDNDVAVVVEEKNYGKCYVPSKSKNL
ncbi:phospholipase A2 inhibitor and Ly6/PLAUR domain-containing protein-like isoform X1 [Anomaloglossus baeobatrachus]|uniref:phospholipase A2 inhibitor and Ly6/PLAUR domain-containing protein-like isoform X1 n=1 Tax=Anomaloglossus baeobatrachus TaxID=238106 RepID=UPI003F504A1A